MSFKSLDSEGGSGIKFNLGEKSDGGCKVSLDNELHEIFLK